jgi:hypothetical protein
MERIRKTDRWKSEKAGLCGSSCGCVIRCGEPSTSTSLRAGGLTEFGILHKVKRGRRVEGVFQSAARVWS